MHSIARQPSSDIAVLTTIVSTENGLLEFCTGIARAIGLRPDFIYRYSVLRRGRLVPGASGTFRTMPEPSSMAPIVFCVVSCNTLSTDGVWADLEKFIKEAKPSFLLMMGDQVYIDEDDPNVFKEHYDSNSAIRRRKLTGNPINLGAFKVSNIDEARDQWSHKFARPEQRDLLRKAAKARFTNRPEGNGRELIFLSGDIHVGCIFDIAMSDPDYKIVSLTSSGISAKESVKGDLFVGSYVDEDFKIASGIRSTLREIIPDFNFGVVQVLPTGDGAEITALIAHEGNAFAAGLNISKLI